MRWLYHPLLLLIARSTDSELAKQVEFLKAENQMLRRRLPKQVRPTPAEWALLLRLGRGIGNAAVAALITITTYRSWVRRLRAARERSGEPVSPPRRNGRPRTPPQVRELVERLAAENGDWGYTRILGEFRKLGLNTSRTNVINILRGRGHDPRTDATKGGWAEFLRSHAATLWQCDFFQKYAAAPDGRVRQCFALAFVHVATRRVWVSPSTFGPTEAWAAAQAAAFVAHAKAQELGPGIVLRDNDGLYRGGFDAALAAGGATATPLAFRAPNTNAYAERFVQRSSTSAWTGSRSAGPGTWTTSSASTSRTTTPSGRTREWGTGRSPATDGSRRPRARSCAGSGWAGCCGTTTARPHERAQSPIVIPFSPLPGKAAARLPHEPAALVRASRCSCAGSGSLGLEQAIATIRGGISRCERCCFRHYVAARAVARHV